VAESHSAEAGQIARDNPNLDVGLHAVVCQGRSVLPQSRISPIVNSEDYFPQRAAVTGLRWYFNKRARSSLNDELRAQVERHLQLVGYLNHIDGHLNFHVHPVVADILIGLAVEYKVPSLRLPREPVFTTLRLRRDHAMAKMTEAIIFRALCRRASRLMRERGLKSTDALFGLHQSGHIDEEYVLKVIDRLPDGITELYFHPAVDIGATPPSAQSQVEADILVSARVRDALAARGVALTNFGELSPQKFPAAATAAN
jgi:chitin disaccharide deacetylase